MIIPSYPYCATHSECRLFLWDTSNGANALRKWKVFYKGGSTPIYRVAVIAWQGDLVLMAHWECR